MRILNTRLQKILSRAARHEVRTRGSGCSCHFGLVLGVGSVMALTATSSQAHCELLKSTNNPSKLGATPDRDFGATPKPGGTPHPKSGAPLLLGGLVLGVCSLPLLFYRKCPPNKVMVIYGLFTRASKQAGASKIVHGGGSVVLPLFQSCRYLSLEPFTLDIPLKNALSLEKIRLNIPAAFTVVVGTEQALLDLAAVRLLGMSDETISMQAEEIITGQMRQVIASLEIEQINRDRSSFLDEVKVHCDQELNKLGLTLVNVNVQNIFDESGVIEALGKKAAALATQQALIDVASQERTGAIGVANERKEQEVNVAIAEKERSIGLATQERERQIGVAEAERERVVGVREAEQIRDVRVQELSAQETIGRNLAKEKEAESDADLRASVAGYRRAAETAEALATAQVAEAQARAQAKAAVAHGERVEAEKRAELEAPARAAKAELLVQSEARAEQIRIMAEGEAAATFVQADASARGEYQKLSKTASGLGEIVDKCDGADNAFKLLMLEHLDKLMETSAKAISNIKFDKVVVWDGAGSGKDGGDAIPNFIRGVTGSLPPTMEVLKEVAGIDVQKLMTQEVKDEEKKEIEEKKPTECSGAD